MKMSDIQEISIVAGPGPIAYDFEPVNGILTVWIGEYADKAPETPTLQRTEISPPYTAWGIEQKQERKVGEETGFYEQALLEIVDPLWTQNTAMIREKIEQLKQGDGESWACGEILERVLNYYNAITVTSAE